MNEHRMLIDGGWVPARSGATRSILNPHDGSELARVAEGDRSDVSGTRQPLGDGYPNARALGLRRHAEELCSIRRSDSAERWLRT